MNHGVLANRRSRHGDARNAGRRRQRGEERKRKMSHGGAEFRTVGPVPGINGIEGFERRDAGTLHHADQIQARIDDGARAVGEADQRQHRPRGPHFGVIGAGGLQRGQRQDDVANGAGADEQAASQRTRSIWMAKSSTRGARHSRLLQAW